MSYEVQAIASLNHISELIRIHNAVWDRSSGIIELLENSTECFILLDTQAQKVIAYLFLEHDKEGGFAEINDIAVDPNHRRKGCGKILMKYALDRYNYLKLNVDATDQKAINFYQQLGFETEAIIENYYKINKDALRMVWRKNKISSLA
jgi:ribosomal protein S18 acetylase RimI-like enzyme